MTRIKYVYHVYGLNGAFLATYNTRKEALEHVNRVPQVYYMRRYEA